MAGLDPKHNSRALTEGLTAQQSDEEFNAALDSAITAIAKASNS